jgi:hypothetical protein
LPNVITISCANGGTIAAEEEGTVPILDLSPEATQTKIFKHMNTCALISLGQLYNAEWEVYMSKTECDVFMRKKKYYKQNKIKTGMWLVQNYDTTVHPKIQPKLNSAYAIRVKIDLVKYLHAAAFCPALSHG